MAKRLPIFGDSVLEWHDFNYLLWYLNNAEYRFIAYSKQYQTSSCSKRLVHHTSSAFKIVSNGTYLAVVVLPSCTIFHRATVIDQIVVSRATNAFHFVKLLAAFNLTLTSFESEIWKAVGTLTSLVSNTACLHWFTKTLISQVETTLASNTFVVVISLAMMNLTVSVVKDEGLVAFLAHMVHLIFAAQNGIHHTDVVVQAEAMGTVSANLSWFICKFYAVFDGFFTRSSFKIKI